MSAPLRSARLCGDVTDVHEDAHPVVVAYDGSAEARAAVTAAATLFTDRRIVVVSVWEPGLAMMMSRSYPDPLGATYPMPSAEEVATVEEIQRDHATATAGAGADLARGLGATAEAHPVPDSVEVAATIGTVAEELDAAAVVVGSRGLGGVKSKLFGSTSRRLLHDSKRPVLIVRAPE